MKPGGIVTGVALVQPLVLARQSLGLEIDVLLDQHMKVIPVRVEPVPP